MNIYTIGPIGYERAYELLRNHRQEVEERFPKFFIKQFESIGKRLYDIKMCADVLAFEISEGGLFGSLWTAMSEVNKGCEINLRDIPVRQEVIEIMELFGENPYEVPSKNAQLLLSNLNVNEINAAYGRNPASEDGITLIGYTTNKKDRVVICEEQRRFLTPLKRQIKDIADRQHFSKNER